MAAIDIALWDIKGKALGVPVYELLGGKNNETIRAYASQLQFDWGDVHRNITKPEDYYEATKKEMCIRDRHQEDRHTVAVAATIGQGSSDEVNNAGLTDTSDDHKLTNQQKNCVIVNFFQRALDHITAPGPHRLADQTHDKKEHTDEAVCDIRFIELSGLGIAGIRNEGGQD